MIHYTCDLCGCSLGKERFEVKIEVAPAFNEDELTAEDLDQDHLQLIADEIQQMSSTSDFELPETGPKQVNYDFCPRCAERYLKAPLNPAPASRVTYSNN